jgi:hypothetical protein
MGHGIFFDESEEVIVSSANPCGLRDILVVMLAARLELYHAREIDLAR